MSQSCLVLLEFCLVPSFVAHSSVASFGLILLFMSMFGRLVTFSGLGEVTLSKRYPLQLHALGPSMCCGESNSIGMMVEVIGP